MSLVTGSAPSQVAMLPCTTAETVRFAAASLGDFVRGHVGVVDVPRAVCTLQELGIPDSRAAEFRRGYVFALRYYPW